MSAEEQAIVNEIKALKYREDDLQTQIYIVSGVLGGACGVLLVALLIMIVVAVKLNKKIKDAEDSRRIQAEISARKFSAYTGEEVHRRLNTTAPAVGGNNAEYAFNYPVSDYKLNSPAPPGQRMI